MELSRNEMQELLRQDAAVVRRIEKLKYFLAAVRAEIDSEGPDGDESYVGMLTVTLFRAEEKIAELEQFRFCQE